MTSPRFFTVPIKIGFSIHGGGHEARFGGETLGLSER